MQWLMIVASFTAVMRAASIPGRITKSGGFVWARLDRVFTNPAWADVFSYTMVKDLPRSTSDHSPMLIQIDEGVSFHPSSFKCQNMWIKHPDFLQI